MKLFASYTATLVLAVALTGVSAAPLAAEQATDQATSSITTTSIDAPAAVGNPLVERGRYLVQGVAMCGQCHTPRNAHGELDQSAWLHGAPVPVSMPSGWPRAWAYKAPRIAGLPQHTDEQFVTLMTTGVNRDGRVLMLPMPPFRMVEDDARAIAAYLRTLD